MEDGRLMTEVERSEIPRMRGLEMEVGRRELATFDYIKKRATTTAYRSFHLFKIFSYLKMKKLKISSHSGTPDEF